MAKPKIETVDDYIAGFPGEVKERLKTLRGIIKKVAPKAAESISYNMPLYKNDGKLIVSFAAWKTHIGMYPAPQSSVEFKKKLKPYEGAKATLRFSHKEKLPVALISKVVKLRLRLSNAGK